MYTQSTPGVNKHVAGRSTDDTLPVPVIQKRKRYKLYAVVIQHKLSPCITKHLHKYYQRMNNCINLVCLLLLVLQPKPISSLQNGFIARNDRSKKPHEMIRQSQATTCAFLDRRECLNLFNSGAIILTSAVLTKSDPALATTGSIRTTQFATKRKSASKTTDNPKEAFANLLKAKEELEYAQTIVVKAIKSNDDDLVENLKSYLNDEAVNINDFEGNALALLQSKSISDETRKEIGTIRRYGIGADVQIMYGGLISELDASEYPDLSEVSKYLTRTLDSLNEVILLCKGDGL